MKLALDLTRNQFILLCGESLTFAGIVYDNFLTAVNTDSIVLDKAKEIAKANPFYKLAAIKELREWSKSFLAEYPSEFAKYEGYNIGGTGTCFGLRISKELIEKFFVSR
jgi:hypothetical protein